MVNAIVLFVTAVLTCTQIAEKSGRCMAIRESNLFTTFNYRISILEQKVYV